MTVPYLDLADPLNHSNRPGDGPLRVGGKSLPGLPQSEENLPSTPSAVVKRQAKLLGIVRDLWEGAERVQEKGTEYLPKAPGERGDDYNMRRQRAVFHEFFGDTVEGLTGMVFRKDPVLGDDVPEVIRGSETTAGHIENIDNAGTHFDVFARELFQDALVAGHAAVLVEFPKTGGKQSLADERNPAAAIRPYWVPIKKDNIISWRTTVENGVTVLTQVVLKETAMVPDGMFGEKEQVRYRVLYRANGIVGFLLLQIGENRVVVKVDEGIYGNQKEIPLAELRTSGRRSLFESRPPLAGLAYLNLAHYRQWSDQDTSLHKTCVPIFVRIGFEPPTDGQGNALTLGPNDGLDLPINGDAKYVSHDGASLGSVKASLDDLVAQIATLGVSMLSSQKRAAETATAKRIDKTATDSALAVTARGAQDCFERALEFHARYLGQESGGSITINRDFENRQLEPQQISALSALVRDGQLTIETLWKMLQEGNVLPEDFDAEEEKLELDAEAELQRQEAIEIAKATPAMGPNGQPQGMKVPSQPDGSIDKAA